MSKWRNNYLTIVSLIGLLLVVYGIAQIPGLSNPGILALMLLLAVVAQVTATSLFSGEVTVGVSTAISMAVVPFFGPFAAALVNAAAELSVSVISIHQQKPGWRRSLERVGFTVGMGSISVFLGGAVFVAVQQLLGPERWLGQIIPWLIAAVVMDQVKLRFMMGFLVRPLSAKSLWVIFT